MSEFKKVDNHDLGLFAIFDGHLGHDVAKYLQTNLFDNILKEVNISYVINQKNNNNVLQGCKCLLWNF